MPLCSNSASETTALRATALYKNVLLLLLIFYARQLYRQVLLRARISYGDSVRLSVCPSVTTRWYTKHKWDRDSGSSPYGSLEYL